MDCKHASLPSKSCSKSCIMSRPSPSVSSGSCSLFKSSISMSFMSAIFKGYLVNLWITVHKFCGLQKPVEHNFIPLAMVRCSYIAVRYVLDSHCYRGCSAFLGIGMAHPYWSVVTHSRLKPMLKKEFGLYPVHKCCR